MVTFRQRGDFSNLTNWFEKCKHLFDASILDKYGREGVIALEQATPKDTGNTSKCWYYKIQNKNGSATISFHNSNINNGVPIAIILQYGHGTRNGGWVEGRDYINPTIQPLFDKITEEAWREVVGK